MQEKKTITAYKKGLREVILETAMKAFQEKGIRAVKMDDIAEKLAFINGVAAFFTDSFHIAPHSFI